MRRLRGRALFHDPSWCQCEAVHRKFDAAGAPAGTCRLVLLVDATSQAPQYAWGGTRTIGALAAAVVLRAAFPLIERAISGPIL